MKPLMVFLSALALAGGMALVTGPRPLSAQDAEPEQPEIVLPNVVLELEDLSVESVAGSIPQDELIPPEFELPRFEGAVQISETEARIALPLLEEGARTEEASGLVAEGVLGAGTRNHFLGSVALYRFEKYPEGKLLFSHEVMDGFTGEAPGSGYNSREDSISGMVRFPGNRTSFELGGAFQDDEYGLQGEGLYYSRVRHLTQGEAGVEFQPGDHLLLDAQVTGSASSRLLTQSESAVPPAPPSERLTEYLMGASAGVTLTYDRFYAGLSPRYLYRDAGENYDYDLHRFQLTGSAGVQLGASSRLDGDVSWFWSGETGHLFPFDVGLQFYPNDLFSIRSSIGYAVNEYNLWDILTGYPYGQIPDTLRDDHGWYFSFGGHVNVARAWVLSADMRVMDHQSIPNPTGVQDPGTGLYPIEYDEMLTLTTEAGLRYNGSSNFSTYFSLVSELLDSPRFIPDHQLGAELSWKSTNERFGGSLDATLLLGTERASEIPVLDAEGFFRVTESITASAALEDMLYPLLDDPRYSWYPFVTPGLRFTFKTHITF
jgi:hypothetical protein